MLGFDFIINNKKLNIEIKVKKEGIAENDPLEWYESEKKRDESGERDATYNKFRKEFIEEQEQVNQGMRQYAVKGIIEIISGKFSNIKKGFTGSSISFLKDLELVFSFEDSKNEETTGKKSHPPLCFYEKIIEQIFRDDSQECKTLKEGYSNENVLLFENIEKELKGIKLSANNIIVKIGDYEKIHREVKNYKDYIVPFVNPRATIGFSQEYKYLEWGAFTSLFTTTNTRNLYEFLKGKDTNEVTKKYRKALESFYEKIIPFKSFELTESVIKDFNALIEKLKKYFDKQASEQKELEKYQKTLGDVFENIIKQKMELVFSIVHGDFSLKNILIAEEQMIFIDFPHTRLFLFPLDIEKLYHYLIIEKIFKDKGNDDLKKLYLGSLANEVCENLTCALESFADEKLSSLKIKYNDLTIEKTLSKIYINLWSLKWEIDFSLYLNTRLKIIDILFEQLTKHLGISNKDGK